MNITKMLGYVMQLNGILLSWQLPNTLRKVNNKNPMLKKHAVYKAYLRMLMESWVENVAGKYPQDPQEDCEVKPIYKFCKIAAGVWAS